MVRTKRSSVLVAVVVFSSAMVINGGGAVVDEVADCFEGSRKGLLGEGLEEGSSECDCGVGSSKGEAGLLGKGDPARLRKGLLDERLRDSPGDG